MSLEHQRYGRNKATLINSAYINSGEYRNKFDKITENKRVNRVLYSKAKEMLEHRSGTLLEDMYWVDGDTGEIIVCALNEQTEGKIVYSDFLKKVLKDKTNVITMHTHPHSMPPSIADFNSAFKQRYVKNIVICHDGKVFYYNSREEIEDKLYNMYIERFIKGGFTEYEAQLKTLEKLKMSYNIEFYEVN